MQQKILVGLFLGVYTGYSRLKNTKEMNKRKIVNDPVYGLISIPYEIVFDVIEHPYFQRLRRIRQLGLTNLIYPGATHTRFEHVLGAMHLMTLAIDVLRGKGVEITEDEAIGLSLAILLHDIGHGPFSHTMEERFISGVSHEQVTVMFMEELNKEFSGQLNTCLQIFKNQYPKKFLHQLVSSQLDMDRLDYLGRDSFYSGVSEGVIGAERIIKMLTLHKDQLVVEAKGIYSIENFLIARRLMYWQVYLHKTSLAAETLLIQIFERAKKLALSGEELFASPALRFFIYNDFSKENVFGDKERLKFRDDVLLNFGMLDDTDVLSAIKVWTGHTDTVLAKLSSALIHRNLFKVEIRPDRFTKGEVDLLTEEVARKYGISVKAAKYFVYTDSVSNHAYSIKSDKINILFKDGSLNDISRASDMLNISVLSKNVKKHFLCYPKEFADYRFE